MTYKVLSCKPLGICFERAGLGVRGNVGGATDKGAGGELVHVVLLEP
jgi:hypothetical protein